MFHGQPQPQDLNDLNQFIPSFSLTFLDPNMALATLFFSACHVDLVWLHVVRRTF